MPPVTLLTTPGARNLNHKVLAKIPGLLFLDSGDFLLGDEMSCAMLLGKTMKNDRKLPKNPNALKFYIHRVSKRLYGLIMEANNHLMELKKGNTSLRRILNNHRQQEFWTFVFGQLRVNRRWDVFTPHGPQVEALLDRFCDARRDYLLARAPDAADDEAAKNPAELVGLFYAIPDDSDLLFAPSPPGRAFSPIDHAIASAATVDNDESPDTSAEEQKNEEDDTPLNSSLVTMQLWAIVRPIVNREKERLGLRTYEHNELAEFLRMNTQ
ncbi:hypothetical protein JMJ77_0009696 [Colletotrichum scovillei]|uniref:Uncharacterized protein n=1 Tax=Colletotrichum scovillei TaxID=1209932 RepID=A0A9P7R1R7_9PEZI|nr:hypothetical protein JMJ77_0009696 [Colletotrichum scovillei]KAG7052779.1 hypothetical protein JMJ78_0005790 [Colletotrichum scovillei]KAG7065072.1 hypothetical protein JMJ76_0012824 [Colletotrichum scovillei]